MLTRLHGRDAGLRPAVSCTRQLSDRSHSLRLPLTVEAGLIGRETRVLLRHYLEQGIPKAVLAAQLGVSRRTIHHWITTGQLDRDLDDHLRRLRAATETMA